MPLDRPDRAPCAKGTEPSSHKGRVVNEVLRVDTLCSEFDCIKVCVDLFGDPDLFRMPIRLVRPSDQFLLELTRFLQDDGFPKVQVASHIASQTSISPMRRM